MVVLLNDFRRLIHAVLLAFDDQASVVKMCAHLQRILEQAHVFIQRAEEGFNLSGNVNGTSHPIGRSSCYGSRLADGIPPRYAWPLRSPLRGNSLHPSAALRCGQVSLAYGRALSHRIPLSR